MSYLKLIREYIASIPADLIDFNIDRERGRIPTQASSEFITNREQGDWAEDLLLRAINESKLDFIAVKYGKSEKRVTGEDGFEDFFEEYQNELDTIGKRPDILILNRKDYNPDWNFDISQMQRETLDEIVRRALAGIEVRSSSFLFEKYSQDVAVKIEAYRKNIFKLKQLLLEEYIQELKDKNWVKIIENISDETINATSFTSPGWRATEKLKKASDVIKDLKLNITNYQKRNFLSITPKVEDIKVIVKWIETYEVPHFYFQVFFDKVYGLPFVKILEFISDPSNEDKKYFLEGDVKNQNKVTIKINPADGFLVANKVDMPEHSSQMKELNRGRLLFYVTFNGGVATLDLENFRKNLNI